MKNFLAICDYLRICNQFNYKKVNEYIIFMIDFNAQKKARSNETFKLADKVNKDQLILN